MMMMMIMKNTQKTYTNMLVLIKKEHAKTHAYKT